jgi:hypothetical protein
MKLIVFLHLIVVFSLIYSFISLLSQGHYHHVDNSVYMVVLTIYITIESNYYNFFVNNVE